MTDYFIDTNILWWYQVSTSRYHSTVKKFLDPLILEPTNNFIVNEFVMTELMHLLISYKGKEGYKIAKLLLDGSLIRIDCDINSRENLLDILEKLDRYAYTLGGREAGILHSMEKHRITDIITDDDGFTKVPGIVTYNPVLSEMASINEKKSLRKKLRSQFL